MVYLAGLVFDEKIYLIGPNVRIDDGVFAGMAGEAADGFESCRGLQRRRGELVERPFAHQYETGGLRRVWVRGHENVRKRVLIQAAGCNLGLLLRRLTGVGTPRSLQGRALSAILGLIGRLIELWGRLTRVWAAQCAPAALVHSIPHHQAA